MWRRDGQLLKPAQNDAGAREQWRKRTVQRSNDVSTVSFTHTRNRKRVIIILKEKQTNKQLLFLTLIILIRITDAFLRHQLKNI